MAVSLEEARLRQAATARSRRAVRTRRLPLAHRLMFVTSLIVFGAACAYSSTALFARAYPALFPGQKLGDIGVVSTIVPNIKGLGAVNHPDTNSSFNDNITLLIMGVDKRPQNPDGANLTDVVMIATMDPIGKTVNFLSFPRDMQIKIHTSRFTYEDRINTSYGVGYRDGGNSAQAGADQLARDIEGNFAIKTDAWMLLDFKGVEELIDSVGGIDVEIPYELSVPNWYYSDDDIHAQYVAFPPGVQHLDGYHAVAFGRYRNDSDFYRIKRQQLVLQTAIQAVFAKGILNQNPFELWDIYNHTVKTDMSRTRMAGLIPLLRQTQARTKMYSLADPVNGVQTMEGIITGGGASVQIWNPDNVQYWLSQVFTKAAYAASSVEIQNGYGIDGEIRAEALGRYLRYSKGLPTVYIGPNEPAQPQTTITLYGDKRQLAEDIAKWLGVRSDDIRVEPRPADSTLPDVLVVVGKDFKLPG